MRFRHRCLLAAVPLSLAAGAMAQAPAETVAAAASTTLESIKVVCRGTARASNTITTGMESIEAYTVVNLNAGFKGAAGTALAPFSTQLNVYNLLDDDAPGYDEFGESGGGFYLTPPRAVYLTLRADL